MKILFLTRYGELGASSRLRACQYIPFLKGHGIEAKVAPLLDDRYVRDLYAGNGRSPARLAVAYCRRLLSLAASRDYDLLWIEKELFPLFPAIERLLPLLGKPYVADYDDAVFHNYDLHPNPLVRRLLGKKIDAVMRRAALVTAGNEYLAARARAAGAGRVERLPTVIDLERYPVPPTEPDTPFTVGWIGSPSTAKYLQELRPALEKVCAGGAARILLIGIDRSGLEGLPVEYRPWSEETEAASLAECHVGIMPLPDGPWERGKCGYKLIQYMGGGLPVVASPVGVNREIVDAGTGFLPDSIAGWGEALATLRDDRSLRVRLGRGGRKKVEEKYSLQVTAPRFEALMRQAVEEGSR